MAGGCTLFVSRKDCDDIEASRNSQELAARLARIPDELRSEVRAVLHRVSAGRLLPILANPTHRAYPLLQEKLAVAVGGRENMTEEEYQCLPRAFYVVLKDHPDAMGIFEAVPQYRGPGASALHEPYEILAAAALRNPHPTSLGRNLVISSQDRPDFGLKMPREFAQPSRYGTIEADILVYKPDGREVGIDAKHTRNGVYSSTQGLNRQLEGIRNKLNDGTLHEFYYVTNGRFSDPFRKLVDQANLELAGERAERYHVPQIGLCEHVVFDG